MNSNFGIAGVIAFVYIIMRFIEIRFVSKETKPVKQIVRDTIVVYISSIVGLFVIEQVDASEIGKTNAVAFVGSPEF